MIDSLMNKKEKSKYHIYIYDNIYVSQHGPHLLNLEEYLPNDHINMYDSKNSKTHVNTMTN